MSCSLRPTKEDDPQTPWSARGLSVAAALPLDPHWSSCFSESSRRLDIVPLSSMLHTSGILNAEIRTIILRCLQNTYRLLIRDDKATFIIASCHSFCFFQQRDFAASEKYVVLFLKGYSFLPDSPYDSPNLVWWLYGGRLLARYSFLIFTILHIVDCTVR